MGDTNLNFLRWDVSPAMMNSYDRAKKPMIDAFKNIIFEKGFTLLNKTVTRNFDSPESIASCLDMMIMNQVEKIISHQSGLPAFSDHTMQIMIRATKGVVNNPQFMRIRSFKNFSQGDYKANILNHHKYVETLYEVEPDILTENIQNIMQESLNNLAPIKIVQLSNKNLQKLSCKVRSKMAERDLAFWEAKQSKKWEDIRNHKNLKN